MGQKRSQDAEPAASGPSEAQESAEAPAPRPLEPKKVDDAPPVAARRDPPATQFEREAPAPRKDEPEASSGTVDDIAAYGQYLDANLGKQG